MPLIRTQADLDAAMQAGGNYMVTGNAFAQNGLSLVNANPAKPLWIRVATDDLPSITIGSDDAVVPNPAHITIDVPKEFNFPAIQAPASFPTGAVEGYSLRNITILGDPTSTHAFAGLSFTTKQLRVLDNLTFDGVVFANGENISSAASRGVGNVTVRNCVFNMPSAAATADGISFKFTLAPAAPSKIVIENNTIVFPQLATGDYNGIVVMSCPGNDVTISGNTVKNAPYHGIQVRSEKKVVITGNTVTDAANNAVRVMAYSGSIQSIAVTGNTLSSFGGANNADPSKSYAVVRLDNLAGAAGTPLTVTGNSILNNAGLGGNNGLGIEIAGAAATQPFFSPLLSISGNTHRTGSSMERTLKMTNITPYAGSVYAQPFLNSGTVILNGVTTSY